LLAANGGEKLSPVDAVGDDVNDIVGILDAHELLEPSRNHDFVKWQSIRGLTARDRQVGKYFVVLDKVSFGPLVWVERANPFRRLPPSCNHDITVRDIIIDHRTPPIKHMMADSATF